MTDFFSQLGNQGHWYSELINSPLFLLTLSLATFQLSNIIYRKLNHMVLLHPIIVAAILVTLTLNYLELDYQNYYSANQLLMFWLGPATVALAVPLYQQFHLIRKMALPILITVSSGAIFAAGSAVAIAYLLDASDVTMLSLVSKSVTTPIAIAITKDIGGLTTLTAAAVPLTAAITIIVAPLVFKLLKISDPKIRGLCLGITAHGIGTARAFEQNATAGAFASLAMCLTGALSATIIPIAISVIMSS